MPRPDPDLVAAWDAFRAAWDHFNGPPATPEVWSNPRPENWRGSISAYYRLGVSGEQITKAVRIAFERADVPKHAKFAYVCGVLKKYASGVGAHAQRAARQRPLLGP